MMMMMMMMIILRYIKGYLKWPEYKTAEPLQITLLSVYVSHEQCAACALICMFLIFIFFLFFFNVYICFMCHVSVSVYLVLRVQF